MNYRDIKLAHPKLQKVWPFLREQYAIRYADDPQPFLSQVFRPREMQAAYYAQGRKTLAEVNALRKKADLAPILAKENKIITYAPPGNSKHERSPSEAFDIAFVKPGTKTELDQRQRLFSQAADIVKELDPTIVWGGSWKGKKVDLPHFQC